MAELATARVARKPLAARCPVAGRRRARAAAAGRCLPSRAHRTARSRPVYNAVPWAPQSCAHHR
eukprot:scaffold9764_cov150-Isochrysis_galbana.AAC.2